MGSFWRSLFKMNSKPNPKPEPEPEPEPEPLILNPRINISSKNEMGSGVDLSKASCFSFTDIKDETAYFKIEEMLSFDVEYEDYLSQLYQSNSIPGKTIENMVASNLEILEVKISKQEYSDFLTKVFPNIASDKDLKFAFDKIYDNINLIFQKEYGQEKGEVVYKFHLVNLGFLLCKHEKKSKLDFIADFFLDEQLVSGDSYFDQFLLVLLVFSTLSMYDICNALSNRFGNLNKEEIEKRKKYNYDYFRKLIQYFKIEIFGEETNSSNPNELKDLKQEDFKAVFQKNGFCWPFSPSTIRMYVDEKKEDDLPAID